MAFIISNSKHANQLKRLNTSIKQNYCHVNNIFPIKFYKPHNSRSELIFSPRSWTFAYINHFSIPPNSLTHYFFSLPHVHICKHVHNIFMLLFYTLMELFSKRNQYHRFKTTSPNRCKQGIKLIVLRIRSIVSLSCFLKAIYEETLFLCTTLSETWMLMRFLININAQVLLSTKWGLMTFEQNI